ncbi:MAG: hypothetical protein H6898_06975 [Rhodobacter sp.]|nr:hypothetical protein [Paracoccaceae bacterium]MCC0076317.1 hypothetical protein [Rhodobacter sp.]
MSMTAFLRSQSTRFLPVAVACGLAFAALPAQAEYAGGGYLSDYRGCESNGWPTNIEMVRARYSPSEEGGNTSEIVLDLAVGASMVYRVNGALEPNNRWRAAEGYNTWGALYRSTPRPSLQIRERRSAISGGATIPASYQIYMQVRIRNFNGARGCYATANLMLRHTGD